MKALKLIYLFEGMDLVSDIQNIQKVIQKELQRQKISKKIKTIKLPDEKDVLFNRSSGGGNITIEAKNVMIEFEDGSKAEGIFKIYLAFRNETFTISYNFFINKGE